MAYVSIDYIAVEVAPLYMEFYHFLDLKIFINAELPFLVLNSARLDISFMQRWKTVM
jgi:hypothetical protein